MFSNLRFKAKLLSGYGLILSLMQPLTLMVFFSIKIISQ